MGGLFRPGGGLRGRFTGRFRGLRLFGGCRLRHLPFGVHADVLFLHDLSAHIGQLLQLVVVAVQLQLVANGVGQRHADARHSDQNQQHLENLHI